VFKRQYFDEMIPEETKEEVVRDRVAPYASDEQWENMKEEMKKKGTVLRNQCAEYWWE